MGKIVGLVFEKPKLKAEEEARIKAEEEAKSKETKNK